MIIKPSADLDQYLKKFFIESLPDEIWVDIPNFEGFYQASSLGRIKSMVREINMSNGATGLFYERVMSNRIKNNVGYYCTELCKNGKRCHFLVHRLLAICFIPNPLNYKWVNHKDGDKLNNKLSNLEWCTPSQNQQHAYDMGLKKPMDGNTYAAKLSIDDVVNIRIEISKGVMYKDICKNYPVSQSQISNIKTGKRWTI